MKLDLRSDQNELRAYVERRVENYGKHKNIGPGNAEESIQLIAFGFYAEQGGYVNLVFDTRPDARVDGEWTIHLENDTNQIAFPGWFAAYEAIWDNQVVTVIKHDGTTGYLQDSDGDVGVNRMFGEMIIDLMIKLRADGTLQKLPLGPGARMFLEEFDGRYRWPDREAWGKESLVV